MATEQDHNDVVVGQFTAEAPGYARLVEGLGGGRASALAVISPQPDDVVKTE